MQIRLKRAYEAPGSQDGTRVLVDGLWPRGVSKGEADIDRWLRDIAPSKALRKWFDHDPEKWKEFKRRYHRELDTERQEAAAELKEIAQRGRVTLVFGSKDEEHNNAVALKEYLEDDSRSEQ